MGTVLTLLVIAALIACAIAYSVWLQNGVKPRTLTTTLSPDEVRAIFVEKVARAGWTIVDDGNPMVAQSPLITGSRQQIGLSTERDSEMTSVDVRPLRLRVKVLTRTPTKGHTLRLRLNAFVAGVQQKDPAMQLASAEPKTA